MVRTAAPTRPGATTVVTPSPVEETAKLMGSTRAIVILHELMKRPQGFQDLKRALGDVRGKALSESLTTLQDHGLVRREVLEGTPVRVRYALTDKGADLEDVFQALIRWGETWDVC